MSAPRPQVTVSTRFRMRAAFQPGSRCVWPFWGKRRIRSGTQASVPSLVPTLVPQSRAVDGHREVTFRGSTGPGSTLLSGSEASYRLQAGFCPHLGGERGHLHGAASSQPGDTCDQTAPGEQEGPERVATGTQTDRGQASLVTKVTAPLFLPGLKEPVCLTRSPGRAEADSSSGLRPVWSTGRSQGRELGMHCSNWKFLSPPLVHGSSFISEFLSF